MEKLTSEQYRAMVEVLSACRLGTPEALADRLLAAAGIAYEPPDRERILALIDDLDEVRTLEQARELAARRLGTPEPDPRALKDRITDLARAVRYEGTYERLEKALRRSGFLPDPPGPEQAR